ncbi:cell division protein FtsK [Priestia megaterium]|uniref:FtsK/SpoIIIE domain-containing protein n=1 Tax=Priestia megaterium TaxID=1404 RepID=UPI000BF73D33|nr:FtsK/SpoIIIE domain-containing protein [Priestia megaterium]PEZ47051.1 cell division protein FtsK [Priestia megaterium]
MIFETVTTLAFGALALKARLSQTGESNDSAKLQKIFNVTGLNVKDGKETYTTQLVKRKVQPWGVEYKYRLPLGRSFEDYQAKFKTIEAGLATRRVKWEIKDFRELKLTKDIIKDIQTLYKKKLSHKKEVELVDDNFLIIRVYNEPMVTELPWFAGTGWKVPVGQIREQNKKIFLDFEKIPHIVLGGATRYGKSNYINTLICSLLYTKPNCVKFHLIDLKGGVELSDYENLEQTVSIAYEPEEALETLKGAYNSMLEVQKRLKKLGKKKVQDAGIEERHFIIIDEVGELNPDEAVDKKDIVKDGVMIHKSEKTIKLECQLYMSKIARLGAGLGFRQILATQYGTGDIIPRQCKQNSDGKLCFRVQNGTASNVVLNGEGAEKLPDIKGRAIWQTPTKKFILQTPLINSTVIHQAIEKYIVEKTKEEVNESANENTKTSKPQTRKHSLVIEETRFS